MGKKKARIAELEAQVRLQQETLAVYLYIGQFEFNKLTTDRRDCLADAVDEVYNKPEGDDLMERWWRD